MTVLTSVSYDQYKNIPSYDDLNIKVKIVFSSECYKNIMQMGVDSINYNREYGRFFVGRKISTTPEVIYFDYNTSEFSSIDGPMGSGKAVIPSTTNYNELNNKIAEYRSNGIKPVVLHFHSHPRDGIYESFSDQDLCAYAKMAATNKKCDVFGMLGFPANKTSQTFGMCIVKPLNSELVNDVATADFVRCEDICYTNNNDIYKVGGFEKKYDGRLFDNNSSIGVVRHCMALPYDSKVCAEGLDPNTGNKIKPTLVGYIDATKHLCFTAEKLYLSSDMINASQTNLTGFHR